MKKLAVLWSSTNTDGLTASARDRFIAGLTEAGVRYNRDCMLPALQAAGQTYVRRPETGFDRYD